MLDRQTLGVICRLVLIGSFVVLRTASIGRASESLELASNLVLAVLLLLPAVFLPLSPELAGELLIRQGKYQPPARRPRFQVHGAALFHAFFGLLVLVFTAVRILDG